VDAAAGSGPQLAERAGHRADIAWRPSLWFCHDPRMTGIAAAGAAELDATLNRFVTRDGLPGAAAGVVHGDELA